LLEKVVGAADEPVRMSYFTYDAQNRLRFAVSAEGRVTEHRYDGFGQRVATLSYNDVFYATSDLTAAPSEITMQQWVANRTLAQRARIARTDYTYDFRGLLASETVYSATQSSDGSGDTTKPFSRTSYVRSFDGQLLSKVDSNGGSHTYSYDGLGRLLMSTGPGGAVSARSYSDAGHTVTTVIGALVTVERFNAAGELESVVAGGNPPHSYERDAMGRVRRETDPSGRQKFYLYDHAGRKVAEVDSTGIFHEYLYNKDNQLVSGIAYSERLSAAKLAAMQVVSPETGRIPLFSECNSLSAWRPAASAEDRRTWQLYDGGGRLAKKIDALGMVTEFVYTSTGAKQAEIRYAQALAPALLSSLSVSTKASDIVVSWTADSQVERHIYDKDGLLLASVDAELFMTEYVYDAAGLRTQSIRYANRISGEIVSPTSRPDLTLELTASVRPAANNADQKSYYFYDNRGSLTAEVSAELYLTEYVYDNAGNRTKVLRYGSKLPSVPSSISDSHRTAAAAGGVQTTLFAYNTQGLLRSETAVDGTVTSYVYDSRGLLSSKTQGAGTSEARTAAWQYDEFGRVKSEIDGLGNVVSKHYDEAGRVRQTIDAKGNSTFFFYDESGQLAHTINSLGEVQSRQMNAFGELEQSRAHATRLSAGLMTGLTGGRASVTLRSAIAALFNSATDRLNTVTYTRRGEIAQRSEGSGATSYQYDGFGRLKQEALRIDGSGAARNTDFSYDKRGAQVRSNVDVGGLNLVTTQETDAFGRVIQRIDGRNGVTKFAYDRQGRLVQLTDATNAVTKTSYDAFDRVLVETDQLGRMTRYAYDTAARKMTVTSPGGIAITTTYSRFGEVVAVTDGNGKVTSYEFDKEGQLKTTKAHDGSITSSRSYDANGNLVSEKDANGVATEYRYDAANRQLLRIVDPAGLAQIHSVSYDGLGQALTTTDPNGVVTVTAYDSRGMVKSVTVDPAGENLRTEFSYDAAGQNVRVVRGAGSARPEVTEYAYDKAGRRIMEIRDPGGLALTTRYTYDANGNAIARTDANGQIWRFAYDANNRQYLTVSPAGRGTRTFFDPKGNVSRTVDYSYTYTGLAAPAAMATMPDWAAGLTVWVGSGDRTTMMQYDVDGRLVALADRAKQLTRYEYDGAGNIVREISHANTNWIASGSDGGRTFTVANSPLDRMTERVYDSRNQLVFEVSSLGNVREYKYDQKGQVTSTIDYATPAIRGAQAWTVESLRTKLSPQQADRVVRTNYDAAGRVVSSIDASGAISSYRYDAVGRLVMAIVPGADGGVRVSEMAYDAAGRKILEVDPGGLVTAFIYDAEGQVTRTDRFAVPISPPDAATGPRSAASIRGSIVVNAADRSELQAYDASGRAVYSVSDAGVVRQMTYDAMGNITRTVTYAKPIVISSGAMSAAQIAGLVSPSMNDRRSANVYDNLGLLTASIDGNGTVSAYLYTAQGELAETTTYSTRVSWTSTTSIEQQVIAVRQNGASDTLKRREGRLYDSDGRLRAEIDATGAVRGYAYNAFNEVISMTEYAQLLNMNTTETLESQVGKLVSGPANRVTSYVFDNDGRQTTEIDTLGQVKIIERNALGQVVTVTTRALRAELLSDQSWKLPLASVYDRIERTAHDANGRVRFTIDGQGHVRESVYAASGDLVRELVYAERYAGTDYRTAALALWADARQAQARISHRIVDEGGQLRFTINALGEVSEYEYNAFGELSRSVLYAGEYKSADRRIEELEKWTLTNGVGARSERKVYGDTGELRFTVNSLGEVSEFRYNALGDLTDSVDYAASYSGEYTVSALAKWCDTYAVEARVATTQFDAAGHVVSTVSQSGQVTVYTRNAFNEVETTTQRARLATWNLEQKTWTLPVADTADRVTRSVADGSGRVRFNIDELGRVRETEYNAYGDVVRKIEYNLLYGASLAVTLAALESWSSTRETGARISGTTYDRAGNVTAMISAGGRTTVLERNGFGEVVATIERAKPAEYKPASLSWTLPGADAGDRIDRSVFDANGRQRFTVGALGLVSELEYDEAGSVVRSLTYDEPYLGTDFSLNALSTWTSGQEADARITHTAVDALGRVRFEVNGLGEVREREYDALGNQVRDIVYGERYTGTAVDVQSLQTWSGTREAGARIDRRVVDAEGRVRFAVNTAGEVREFRYDAFGSLVRTINFSERYTDTAFTESAVAKWANDYSAGARVSTNVVDARGAVRFVVGPSGQVTENEYNALGDLVRELSYDEQYLSADVSLAALTRWSDARENGARATTYLYDKDGSQYARVDASGKMVSYSRNRFNEVTSVIEYVRPASRSASGAYTLPAPDPQDRVTRSAYDLDGRVRFTVDALGRVSEQEYGVRGEPTRSIVYETPYTGTDFSLTALVSWSDSRESGARVSVASYDRAGRASQSIDATGQVTAFSYNIFGDLIATRKSGGTVAGWPASVSQEAIGVALASPGTRTETYLYDQLGRQNVRIDWTGQATVTQFDVHGQAVGTIEFADVLPFNSTLPLEQQVAARVAAKDMRDRRTATVYDADGRVVTTVGFRGEVETLARNAFGEVVAVAQFERAIDWASNQPLEVLIADVTGAGAVRRLTSMAYNQNGQLMKQTDPMGRVTEFEYDVFGQLVVQTEKSSAGDRRTASIYDKSSRLIGTADAMGRVTSYSYNIFGEQIRSAQHSVAVDWAKPTRQVLADVGQVMLNTASAARQTAAIYNRRGDAVASVNAGGEVTTYEFNLFGEVTAQINRANQVLWGATASIEAQVAALDTHADDRVSSTLRSADGRTVYTVSAGGAVVRSQFDSFGTLVNTVQYAAQLPAATPRTFAKVSEFLQTQNASNDRGKSIVFNADRTVQYQVEASGHVVKLEFNHFGQLIRQTVFDHPLVNWQAGRRATPENLATLDAGQASVTDTIYNGAGQPVYQIDPLGFVVRTLYDGFGNVTATLRYAKAIGDDTPRSVAGLKQYFDQHADAVKDMLSAQVYNLNGEVRFTVSAEGSVVENFYNDTGDLVGVKEYAVRLQPWSVDVLGEFGVQRAWPGVSSSQLDRYSATVYQADGKVAYAVNAEGQVTRFGYNQFGEATQSVRHANVIGDWSQSRVLSQNLPVAADPLRDRVSYTIFDQNGRARFSVDGEGYVRAKSYSAFGEVTQEVEYPLSINSMLAMDRNTSVQQILACVPELIDGVENESDRAAYTRYGYDKDGRLVSTSRRVATEDGVPEVQAWSKETVSYADANGSVVTRTRAAGTADASVTRSVYDRNGRMVEETIAMGTSAEATTRYEHSANRVRVIDARAVALTESDREWAALERKARGLPEQVSALTAAQKAELINGFTTLEERDRDGRVVRTVAANGAVTVFEYDAFGRQVKVTDHLLNVTTTSYDKESHRITQVDAVGRSTTTSFNAFGEVSMIFKGAAQGMVNFAFNKLGQQIEEKQLVDGVERRVTQLYNAFGETQTKDVYANDFGQAQWVYDYDRRGFLLKETLPVKAKNASGADVFVVNTFEYDARGNLIAENKALNLPEQQRTRYEYTLTGQLKFKYTTDLVSVYDPQADLTYQRFVSEVYQYDLRGNLLKTTLSDGTSTRNYYDAADRRIGEVNAAGAVKATDYDVVGNAWRVRSYAEPLAVASLGQTLVLPAGEFRETTLRHNAANQVTESRVNNVLLGEYRNDLGGGSYLVYSGDLVSTQEYDKLGRLTKQTDARGLASHYRYDAVGRKIVSIVGGQLTSWDYGAGMDGYDYHVETRYGGAPIVVGDSDTAAALRSRASIAAFGVDFGKGIPNGANASQVRRTTTYINAIGETVKQGVWTGSFNAYGFPVEAETSYIYNGIGSVVEQTDADGLKTYFSYDALGRQVQQRIDMTKVVSAAGVVAAAEAVEVAEKITDTVYNGVGLISSQTERGKTAAEDRKVGFVYNNLGRMAARVDATGHVTHYNYDIHGRQTRMWRDMVDADSRVYREEFLTAYDVMGNAVKQYSRSNSVADAWQSAITVSEYNLFGELTGRGMYAAGGTRPAQLQEYFQYDQAGRMWQSNSGDGVVKLMLHDANGNVTGALQSAGAVSLRGKSLADVKNILGNGMLSSAKFTVTEYDSANRVLRSLQPNADLENVVSRIAAQAGAVDLGNQGARLRAYGTTQTSVSSIGPIVGSRVIGSGGPGAGFNYTVTGTGHSNFVLLREKVRHESVSGLANEYRRTLTHDATLNIPVPDDGRYDGGGATAQYEVELWDGEHLVGVAVGEIVNGSVTVKFSDLSLVNTGVMKLYRRVNAGEAGRQLLSTSNTPIPPGANELFYLPETSPPPGYRATAFSAVGGISFAATPSALVLAGQPSDTVKVQVFYRERGTNQPFVMRQMTNAGEPMEGSPTALYRPDVFEMDLALAGVANNTEYEFQFVAVNAAGHMTNSGAGVLVRNADASVNITMKAAPSATTPQVQLGGGALVTTEPVSGKRMLAFFDQGRSSIDAAPAGAQATLRYRTQTGEWLAGEMGARLWSGVKDATGALIPHGGAFSWKLPENETGLVQYVLEVRDANGKVVSQVAGEVTLGAQAELKSYSRLQDRAGVVRIDALPPRTERVKVGYLIGNERVWFDSSDETLPRLLVANANQSASWLWDTATLPAGVYDVQVLAYDKNSALLSDSRCSLRLGADPAQLTRTVNGTPEAARVAHLREGHWQLSGLTGLTVQQSITYDSFGAVVAQTDARGHAIQMAYDFMGNLVSQKVAGEYTDSAGATHYGQQLETRFEYSLGGRMLKSINAKGKAAHYSYVNLKDAEGKDMVYQERHDGNVDSVRTSRYDAFGQLSRMTNEADHTRKYHYDKNGNMVRTYMEGDPTWTNVQSYLFDAAGRQLYKVQSLEDLRTSQVKWSATARTYYDAQGRITMTTSAESKTIQYSYLFDPLIAGLGGSAIGGYVEVVKHRGPNGETLTTHDVKDYFGRQLEHKDLAGNVSRSIFNFAGQLTQKSYSSKGTTYLTDLTYDLNGRMATTTEVATGTRTSYRYDANGNQLSETVQMLSAAGVPQRTLNQSVQRFDAQNRVVEMHVNGTTVTTRYDQMGNVRNRLSSFNQSVGSENRKVQDLWYEYDDMNRVLVNGGIRQSGAIVIGAKGMGFEYNGLGERIKMRYGAQASGNTTGSEKLETYQYFSDGELFKITWGHHTSTRSRGIMLNEATGEYQYAVYQADTTGGVGDGRLATSYYDKDGKLMREVVKSKANADGWTDKEVTYQYRADGTLLMRNEVDTQQSDTTKKWNSSQTTYTYENWDEARQTGSRTVSNVYIDILDDDKAPTHKSKSVSVSSNRFDAQGRQLDSSNSNRTEILTGTKDTKLSHTETSFKLNAEGTVLREDSIEYFQAADAVPGRYDINHRYTQNIVAAGKTWGTLSNDDLQDSFEVKPIGTIADGPSDWTARTTADFDQNFVAINSGTGTGLRASYTVRGGETLQAIAQKLFGDASLWWKIADANGMVGGAAVADGQVLAIPENISGSAYNNADTVRTRLTRSTSLLDLAAAPGNIVRKSGFGITLNMAIIIAFTAIVGIMTAGVGVALGAALAAGTIGLGAFIGTSVAVSVGTAAMINLAQQGTTGNGQIDWKEFGTEVGITAITTLATVGIPQLPLHKLSSAGQFVAKTGLNVATAAAVEEIQRKASGQEFNGRRFAATLASAGIRSVASTAASKFRAGEAIDYLTGHTAVRATETTFGEVFDIVGQQFIHSAGGFASSVAQKAIAGQTWRKGDLGRAVAGAAKNFGSNLVQQAFGPSHLGIAAGTLFDVVTGGEGEVSWQDAAMDASSYLKAARGLRHGGIQLPSVDLANIEALGYHDFGLGLYGAGTGEIGAQAALIPALKSDESYGLGVVGSLAAFEGVEQARTSHFEMHDVRANNAIGLLDREDDSTRGLSGTLLEAAHEGMLTDRAARAKRIQRQRVAAQTRALIAEANREIKKSGIGIVAGALGATEVAVAGAAPSADYVSQYLDASPALSMSVGKPKALTQLEEIEYQRRSAAEARQAAEDAKFDNNLRQFSKNPTLYAISKHIGPNWAGYAHPATLATKVGAPGWMIGVASIVSGAPEKDWLVEPTAATLPSKTNSLPIDPTSLSEGDLMARINGQKIEPNWSTAALNLDGATELAREEMWKRGSNLLYKNGARAGKNLPAYQRSTLKEYAIPSTEKESFLSNAGRTALNAHVRSTLGTVQGVLRAAEVLAPDLGAGKLADDMAHSSATTWAFKEGDNQVVDMLVTSVNKGLMGVATSEFKILEQGLKVTGLLGQFGQLKSQNKSLDEVLIRGGMDFAFSYLSGKWGKALGDRVQGNPMLRTVTNLGFGYATTASKDLMHGAVDQAYGREARPVTNVVDYLSNSAKETLAALPSQLVTGGGIFQGLTLDGQRKARAANALLDAQQLAARRTSPEMLARKEQLLVQLQANRDAINGSRFVSPERELRTSRLLDQLGANRDAINASKFVAPERELLTSRLLSNLGENREAINASKFFPPEYEIVRLMPRGNRPAPETYLSTDVKVGHLKQFESGVSYITSKGALDYWGRDLVGRPDGQFVLPTKELDKILKRTQGNIDGIEHELGIPKGDWKGKELVRIDVPDISAQRLRLGTGNESGANPLWLPGGRLPTGYPEAVVDPIRMGSYTETALADALKKLRR
jgi:YD repeat-containing protein